MGHFRGVNYFIKNTCEVLFEVMSVIADLFKT